MLMTSCWRAQWLQSTLRKNFKRRVAMKVVQKKKIKMYVVVVISKNESTFQCYKLWENNLQTACHVFFLVRTI